MLSWQYLVDIETEWNLKISPSLPSVKRYLRRYRNRVEFKVRLLYVSLQLLLVDIETEWNLKSIPAKVW